MAKAEANVEELVSMIERGELRLPEMQRQYVWRSTRVRDQRPAVYLPPLMDQLGEPAFAAQCIPVEASLLEVESYKTFLLERRKRIATALNTFVGHVD